MTDKNFPYEDILHLSRPVSETHPPMERKNRAAQFSPFAALTGYEDAIREAARLTGERIELDEGEQEQLNAKLAYLVQATGERSVCVTYFEPDSLKNGGAYVTVQGDFLKIDSYENLLFLEGYKGIPFSEIIELSGDAFRGYEQ